MTPRLDLKASFLSSLESRGVPRTRHGEYEFVLYELVKHMGDKPASRWSAIDLEEFLSQKTQELNVEQRSVYGTALAVIAELLDKAERKGASLALEQTDFIAETLRRQVLDDPRVKKTIDKIRARPAAPRKAKRVNQEERVPSSKSAPSSPASTKKSAPSSPASTNKPEPPSTGNAGPGDASTAAANAESNDTDNGDFASARGARTSIRRRALDDSGFGRKRRRRDRPDGTPPPLPEDDGDRDVFDPAELGLSDESLSPDQSGPESQEFELLDLDSANTVPAGRSAALSMLDLDEPDDELTPAPEVRDDDKVSAPGATDPEVGTATASTTTEAKGDDVGVQDWQLQEPVDLDLNGWSTNLARKRTSDGALLLDNLYSIRRLPEPNMYALREPPPSQGALQEFVESNRTVLIVLIGLLLVSSLAFVISELLGAILLLITLLGTGAFTFVAFVANSFDQRPEEAETPEAAVLEYVAALRMGLAHRARNFLAVPADVEPIPLKQLMERHRGELGRRFNVVGPAALRAYWKDNAQQFDRQEGHPIVRLARRLLKPAEVDVREIMRRDDDLAAVCVVGGQTMDAYAEAPVIKMGDTWMVAEGECRMRSARVESLGRLARLHTAGKMDDDGLVDACRRENLTRADVTRARMAGVLTERQAMLLAGRNVRTDVV